MATSDGAVHHYSKRKRLYKNLEPIPSEKKYVRNYDKFMYLVAIVGPLLTLPQVLKIWMYKSAEGVSLITFSGWIIINFCWLTYGIMHKEKPIIMSAILWIIFHTSVITGILMFR